MCKVMGTICGCDRPSEDKPTRILRRRQLVCRMAYLQFLTLAVFRGVSQPLPFLAEPPVEDYGIGDDQDQPGEDGDADTEE